MTVLSFGAANAQTKPALPGQAPAPAAPSAPFSFDDVLDAARRLAETPYQPPPPMRAPPLDYDDDRDIRFRSDRAFLAGPRSFFRLELLPLGSVGTAPVDVNIVHNGSPVRVPFSLDLFDVGASVTPATRGEINGFAGLRLRYPLNKPDVFDPFLVFLRASYFRFVSRGQAFGQSMRALSIGAGDPGGPEEFPRFREFWVIQPDPGATTISLLALIDSPSLAGAVGFDVSPGAPTVIESRARLYARAQVDRLGLAPISSMYFTGQSGPRVTDSYRLEVHDAGGLLMESKQGGWTWRPLRNPDLAGTTAFSEPVAGFGLSQRPRGLDAYEDLSADYDLRPTYWVEPVDGFGAGAVKLVELPEQTEADDNIVVFYGLAAGLKPRDSHDWRLRMSALDDDPDEASLAIAQQTLIVRPGPDMDDAPKGSKRFLIDFAGAALAPFMLHPADLTLVTQAPGARTKTSIAPYPDDEKLRVTLDVILDEGARVQASLQLTWLGRPVSETWTFAVEG